LRLHPQVDLRYSLAGAIPPPAELSIEQHLDLGRIERILCGAEPGRGAEAP
jgi:hypothetical protein